MYYFPSRVVAGEMLAKELVPKYRFEDCAIVALSDGGVMVGAQIAVKLHCVLTMLLTAPIFLPQESEVLAEIDQQGTVTYNDMLSTGELEEIKADYFSYIEQQKLEKKFEMNRLLGAGGLISEDLLRERNVILVSDGFNNGLSLEAAADFLKPIHIKRLIVATPFATVPAVDRMHVLADEIYCINVMEELISIDHYYDTQDVPSHDQVIKTIEQIILNWK
ncbi:MAG: phosphoribosyltransferase family protein [Candidatus Saccharimonadales bacterium]